MIAVAIDPGYDDTGVAIFHIPDSLTDLPFGRTAEQVFEALKSTHKISTSTDDTPGARLCSIATHLMELVGTIPPGVEVRVFVEIPSYSGDYGRTGKVNRASVNKLYMAIGVILGTLQGLGYPPETCKALTSKKEQRHQILELLERTTGRELPRGPRGGVRADEWDAIMVGVTELA